MLTGLSSSLQAMIGRTSLHNVSGTRVATDLAELPSILMEAFTSPSMLPHLVSHYETDKPPSEELLRAHQRQRSHFPSLETATQIHMALLDQSLHSISPKDPNEIDSTRIYHEVTGKLDIFRAEPGTAPQVYFGHLYGYGASYYAYLFDRAIANRVWDVVFARGAGGLDGLRDGGQRLKDHLLRWGGGRESWGMVGALLDDDVIRAGGKEAMMRVGEWGVGDVKR
jgi:intermediate peptidase